MPDTCTADLAPARWPDNRSPEDLARVTAEALALTFGEPPVPGGPYARFERRCLAEYEANVGVPI